MVIDKHVMIRVLVWGLDVDRLIGLLTLSRIRFAVELNLQK